MASKMKRLGWLSVLLGLALWALCAAVLPAQTARFAGRSSAGLPATADAVIEEMAAAAGVIFAGQVTAVRSPSWTTGQGVVEVEFRVDEAVKGLAAGSVYTLREWAGLWNVSGGRGRYRTGQRLLIFLYSPDANGFSSPVRGLDGAVPLRGGGLAPGPDDTRSAAADWMVDLRWMQAQALKTYAPAAPPPGRGPVSPRPIPPGPVRPPNVSPPPAGVAEAEVEAAWGALGAGPLPVRQLRIVVPTPLPVRRGPVPLPGPQMAEVQPLGQVIALCRQAMRSSDGLR